MSWLSNLLGVDADLTQTGLRGSYTGLGGTDDPLKAPADTTESDINSLLQKLNGLRDSLYSDTESSGADFLSKMKGERSQRLTDLSALLREREGQVFDENQPGILEGLSSRGLLHSSGVGEAMARERGRLAAASDFALQKQSLDDLDAEQKIAEDIQNRLFGIKSGGLSESTDLWKSGLERKYGLQDMQTQMALAEKIAGMSNNSNTLSGLLQLLPQLASLF